MKVVMLGKWPTDIVNGGVAVYTINLVRSISKLNRLNLYMISFGSESKVLSEGRTKIILIKARKLYYILPILALIRLALEVKKIKPGVIHVHGTALSPYLIYILFSSLHEYKKLITVYGLIGKEAKFRKNKNRGPIRFLNVLLEKYALLKIPNIITESQYNKSIISKMSKSKIFVIPGGIDFERIQKIGAIPSKKVDIFFVGRLSPEKGVDLLIKAISYIVKTFPHISVSIAGTGEQLLELTKLVQRLHLQNNIRFFGHISEEEKYQHYKACKLVVIPSRWDFSPLTIYEAMACGKPIIASQQTNSEVLKDGKTGLLFEEENVKDLADKILFLLQNEKIRRQMGEFALRRIRKYDWSEIAKKYIEVYKEIIKT